MKGLNWAVSLILLALVTIMTPTCGGQTNNGGDSSTHWLKRCERDEQCGSSSCLCGTCTRSCRTEDQCEAFGADAICVEAASCSEGGKLCATSCEGGEDCHDGVCLGSRCTDERPRINDEPDSSIDPDGAGGDSGGPTPGPLGDGGNGSSSGPLGEESDGSNLGPVGQGGDGSLVDPPLPPPSLALTAAELCEDPSPWLGQVIDVDLSGAVETRDIGTAMLCSSDGGLVCCNWEWTAYVLGCSGGDIVIAVEAGSAPFGTTNVELPDEPFDDSFAEQFLEHPEVTVGCQGMDCAPTCVPAGAAEFGIVRARLEPAEDGWVEPSSGFGEEFQAQAALVVERDLSGSSTVP